MNLILLKPSEAGRAGQVVLQDLRAAHIREVLRAEVGQSLAVGILDGPKGQARVLEITADRVALCCTWSGNRPDAPPVDLLLALPRPKVMKRLWAPLAALGLRRILITNAEKVERYYFDSHAIQPDFVEARLIEGLQQARDTRRPQVTVHRRLKVLVEDELNDLCPAATRIVLDTAASRGLVEQPLRPGERVLLAIGPEGGWTPYEVGLLGRHGFSRAHMGRDRALRSDTACVAAIATVAQLLDRVTRST